MIYLGSYQVDDYIPILVQSHDTSGSAADLDSGSFSIDFYEFDNSDGSWAAMTTPDTTFNTVVDSKTGFYTGAVQLTAANGFESGKVYAARVGDGTVDSQTPATVLFFRVATKAVLDDLNDITAASVGALTVDTDDVQGALSILTALKIILGGVAGNVEDSSSSSDGTVTIQDRSGNSLYVEVIDSDANKTVTLS